MRGASRARVGAIAEQDRLHNLYKMVSFNMSTHGAQRDFVGRAKSAQRKSAVALLASTDELKSATHCKHCL